MLRRLLFYLSMAGWARTIATRWGVAWRVAKRFIAGETIEAVVDTSRALNAQGLTVTLDYLGESVREAADTDIVKQTYRTLLARIDEAGLRASISLKPTHLGLDISEELCLLNLRHILGDAKARGIDVTLDMEGSPYTETTLRLYRTLRDEYNFDNAGTVIQAYLRRTPDDMRALAAEGSTIRLVKGAYLEPPTIALPIKADVDAQFVTVMKDYLIAPPPAYLQIATHDENIIQAAEAEVKTRGLAPDRYEFQFLYGIRHARQLSLAAAGHTVRVYVPFGEAWYPYFMRRLAERPANLWFFISSLFRR